MSKVLHSRLLGRRLRADEEFGIKSIANKPFGPSGELHRPGVFFLDDGVRGRAHYQAALPSDCADSHSSMASYE